MVGRFFYASVHLSGTKKYAHKHSSLFPVHHVRDMIDRIPLRMDLPTNSTLPHEEQFTPEQHLLMAIVYRSILDYLNDTDTDFTLEAKRSAKWWVFPFNREDSTPWTFNWVAEQLSDNPVVFKKTIRNYLKTAPTRLEIREQFGKFGRSGLVGLSQDWRVGV